MTANRFLWKWNARLLRREWPIQAAILAIVAAAAAVSVGGVLAVYNLTPPPERTYGNGQVLASISSDTSLARASLEDQGHTFGEVASAAATLPGVAGTIEIRVQDPGDPVAEPLLGLLEGRWPSGPGEIAATDGALQLLNAGLGAEADIAGNAVTVVGLVENPTDFDDEFVHAATMEPFDVDPERVSTLFLVDAPPLDVVFPAGVGSIGVQSGGEIRNPATLAVDVVAAVAMLEVALLAGAGFAIVARRRARQYGLLGAVGAPPRYLRRIAAMNGLAIGAVAAAAGAIVGVAGAAAVVPSLESSVGHRIDLAIPWSALAPVVVMAVAAAGLAAWWPSRTVTTQSIVASLASQRPQIRPVARTAAIGAAAALAGTVALVAGSVRVSLGLAVTGIVVALAGLLMLSPATVKLMGRSAGRLPLPARLAARALARQQARSAAVVSALVVALGAPAGLAVATAAIDDHNRRSEDNLAGNMAILWLPGTEDNIDEILADLDASAEAGSLDQALEAVAAARVAPIQLAVDPNQDPSPTRFDRLGLRPAVLPNLGLRPATEPCNCDIIAFGDRDETGAELLFSPLDAWVASPALLDALQIDAPAGPEREGLGLSRWDDAVLGSHRQPGDDPDEQLQLSSTLPPYSRIADVLIWPETVAANGWDAVTVGWLIVADSPLTPAMIAGLESAAGPDLLSEVYVEPSPQSRLRFLGLLVGGLMGLGILASVISLHVAESGTDLRVLRAIGASPGAGRRLSSATGAILAASAAVIAVPVGYLPLVPLLADRQLDIRFVVPWINLATIVVVFPMLAAGVGWLSSLRSSTTARLVQ